MPRPRAQVREQEWVQEKLVALPDAPGIYFFKDKKGKVIYVGKAKSVKKRVSSYFSKNDHTLKTLRMVAQARDVEYLVVDSEIEALTVESNCIKKYQPRYNVALKDDKSYPFLRIALNEPFPKAEFIRNPKDDGARYYGPLSASSVRAMVFLVQDVFQLRDCDLDMAKVHPRPCLQFQIKKCSGPCIRAVDEQAYRLQIDAAMKFLNGEAEGVLDALEAEMMRAASDMAYERAAIFRDQLLQVRKFLENQKVVSKRRLDQDFVATAHVGPRGVGAVIIVRAGKIVGREQFPLRVPADATRDEVLEAFVSQHYARAASIPHEVYLTDTHDDAPAWEAWLTQRRGSRVRFKVPQRGEARRLMSMARKNAELYIEEMVRKEEAAEEITRAALEGLQRALNMSALPARIECYDISNLGASNKLRTAVASRVVFINGVPAKDQYRRYRVQDVAWQDDYAMMKETLKRRLVKYGEVVPPEPKAEEREVAAGVDIVEHHGLRDAIEPETSVADPDNDKIDLLLIDGGKGHLHAVMDVVKELELEGQFEVAGLAKKLEELFVPWMTDSVLLPPNSPELHLVVRLRDEAHRFANKYRKLLNSRALATSILDEIPGIGETRKERLLKHFGSVRKIKAATIEEIAQVPGISKATAEAIKRALDASYKAQSIMVQAGPKPIDWDATNPLSGS